MNVYKISSSDLSNIPFIEYQAKKEKPILLSVGASNENEIDRAIDSIRKYNTQPLVLLHCVLEYPTPYEHANLNKITSLKNKYPDLIIGYSDHTKPDENMDVLKTAIALGAVVIEKHFTLDKTLKGNDHYHAMDPSDAAKFLKSVEFIENIKGSGSIRCLDSEMTARVNARRSFVSAFDIAAGTVITPEMLTFKRPGTGIDPSEIDNLIGKKAVCFIAEDTILTYDLLS